VLHTLIPLQSSEQAGAKVPATTQKLLERFIRDGVRETRSKILAVANSIPPEYRTIHSPIYRGCSFLEGSTLDLLTKKVLVKDHSLTSWTYDAKEAMRFCTGSAVRIGTRPGILLVRRTSDKVVINFPDNVAKFDTALRKAIEDYDQQEILVATNNERYGRNDVAAICLAKDRFAYVAKELGWKLKTSFGSKKFVTIVNPGTKPVVYGYK
jgi:hypothetical protein